MRDKVVTRSRAPKGLVCPECGCTVIWKSGFIYNKSGRKQRYQCKDCRRFFVRRRE